MDRDQGGIVVGFFEFLHSPNGPYDVHIFTMCYNQPMLEAVMERLFTYVWSRYT